MTVRAAPRGGVASAGVQRSTVAEDRVRLLFARFIGAGYCFYGLLSATSIGENRQHFAFWWTPTALVLVFGTGVMIGVVAIGSAVTARRVRIAAVVAATGYVIAVSTAPLAWQGPLLVGGHWWPVNFPGLPALALAATVRPVAALAFLVVVTTIVQTVRAAMTVAGSMAPLYTELPFSIMFSLAFVSATIIARRTGRLIDEVTFTSHRAAAAAAATAAREVERERFDALTHDGVMGTLLAACRLGTSGAIVAQADDTLEQLDRLAGGEREADDYSPEGAAAVVRNAIGAADQRAQVAVESAAAGRYPGEVVRTIAAATAEAVRNAARHAGPDAVCRVSVELAVGGLAVTVVDDGCGFDPRAVPRQRLGLAVSVRGRMRQLDGGAAEIASTVGRGTRVRLSWSRP